MLTAGVPYPIEIERGKTQSLSIAITDDTDGSAKTPTSGTVSLYDGSQRLVDAATVAPGNPSTYSLPASVTDGRTPAGDYLLVWALVIDGATETFSQPAYLVRYPYRHVLQSADLAELHPDLTTRDTAGTVDLDSAIRAADAIMRRELVRRGNRPDLVVDAWALFEAHRAKALEIVFRDDAQSVGDGRYLELAEHYAQQYAAQWSGISFAYDTDASGVIDGADERRAGSPVVMLTARKRWAY